ncbi:DapH/DapD/GlmU-related protein [Gordonia sp. YY1]|uniref:DapH/DapD/GlmU-related protein n=1 Tax=Gordonia sp. YY1 TaxID=396712 RepID=UPI001331B2ED|nr:DapH/DapD/GlmU-related protein [Gordonia sp. YY1]
MVMTCSHEVGDSDRRCGSSTVSSVRIGSGCWIGARAVICPGVTIGDGCVIAAGSVVVEDCEPNSLYAGVPAKRKRSLD